MANFIECQECGKTFESRGTSGPKPKKCPDCRDGGLSIKKAIYSWSKYEDNRNGTYKNESDIWYCQACRIEMPKSIPSYLIPLDELGRDFVRVCPKCQHISFSRKIVSYSILVKVVRK